MLADKHILVGVTGGIAAYKSAELVRKLVKQSAGVRVMMTAEAERFVSPLTFATLTGYPVRSDVWSDSDASFTPHIDWARWADMICVAPATANTVAKLANGLSDDMISTTVLAARVPVLSCPSDEYRHV
ncbi:MAG: flavoprotein [candidate division KSB1 bacterium]|nr:flavoprotein [candidate division KSB1 bacterium]